MADQQQVIDPAAQQQQEIPDQPVPERFVDVKLPAFWSSRPAAWFLLAESRFRLRRVETEEAKFDHLLSALQEDVLAQVLDVVSGDPNNLQPYTTLKDRLLEQHTLSDYEKLEKLFKMPDMGARKPSQLLTSMLEFCPAGQEQQIFFHFMFLQRLPSSLRTLLGEVEHGDPRALAARADRLWACHSKQHQTVAAVQEQAEEAEPVAAVRQGFQAAKKQAGKQKPPVKSGGGGKSAVAPTDLARASSGLCWAHWRFGDKANVCKSPCSWQGGN